MKKIKDFIMKVKKFFHQDPESLELKREKERRRRQIELQEVQEMIAEYERMMYEGGSWKVETLRSRMKRRDAEEQKELRKQKELENQQKSEK